MENYSVMVKKLPRICRIGEKVYTIRVIDSKHFEAKCPVCDNTKRISYRGFDLPCPLCETGGNRYYGSTSIEKNTVVVFVYEVSEYIVNALEIEGVEKKSAYNQQNGTPEKYLPMIRKVKAFSRTSSSYYSISTIEIPSDDFLDPDADRVRNILRPEDLCFTTKKKAQEAVAILEERERQKLNEFNEKYGCSFEYPIKEEK